MFSTLNNETIKLLFHSIGLAQKCHVCCGVLVLFSPFFIFIIRQQGQAEWHKPLIPAQEAGGSQSLQPDQPSYRVRSCLRQRRGGEGGRGDRKWKKKQKPGKFLMAKVQKSILVKSQIITFEKKTGETGLENKLIRRQPESNSPSKGCLPRVLL